MTFPTKLFALALLAAGCGSSNSSGGFAAAPGTGGTGSPPQLTPYQLLKQDILIEADCWDVQPRMIAAGLGFTSIIGVPGLDVTQPTLSESLTRAAGGTWNSVANPSGAIPTLGAFTSAVTPQGVAVTYGVPVVNCDGLPVEFSWPILPSTLDATDFKVTLNDGTTVTPQTAGINPNFDFNERAVAVLFGKFGNRFGPDDPRARYPVSVEVVADGTPLQLMGPNLQRFVAVGLKAMSNGTPYTDPEVAPERRGGPRLVGAKLTRMSAIGDGAPSFLRFATPNDGIALYGGRAQYRLRVYTSGGFSPDGVRAMFPTEFARYFRLRAGNQLLTQTDVPYSVNGGSLQIVGLAELGLALPLYDDTYQEDQDNQIDIILEGDEKAMRAITQVEVPSVAPYSPLYNPGGPGNQPTPGVRYSAPSPPHTVDVLIALDNPLTVTYIDPAVSPPTP